MTGATVVHLTGDIILAMMLIVIALGCAEWIGRIEARRGTEPPRDDETHAP